MGGEPEDAVLDGQSCDETRGTYLPAGRESPLLNGVDPTGPRAPPLESRTPDGGRTQQGEDRHRQDSGLETMIRRLVGPESDASRGANICKTGEPEDVKY